MAIDLLMPALSPTMEKGTVAKWLVRVGDRVKAGDLLAEIETDKATMEFEAVDEGTITEIIIQAGTDEVPIGAVIARLIDSDDVEAVVDLRLSPSARRAAKDTGVDPSTVAGTGREGRVTKDDLLTASAAKSFPTFSGVTLDLAMPALSPTMEKGTIARWLVSVGAHVRAGDMIAEIETDKATMELEAAADGTLSEILYGDGSDDIAVGTVIGRLAAGEMTARPTATPAPTLIVPAASSADEVAKKQPSQSAKPHEAGPPPYVPATSDGVDLSPLLSRIATAKRINVATLSGSGAGGKISLADLVPAKATASPRAAPGAVPPARPSGAPPASTPSGAIPDIPHEIVKLSNMRKTIARRLTESKQHVPHIYLTVDVRLDALLKLRTELNEALESRGIRLSVNDMIIKAQALALLATPACNVQHTPEDLVWFSRADISVAVSIPNGLVTPVIVDAGNASLSTIATSMKALAARAREGKLLPSEYQGGTASLSNLGMLGIKQFDAVINPPQAMILAVGAGDRRAIVEDDQMIVASVMSATGSFDHRAIDGAAAASYMRTFKSLVERPMSLIG